MDMIRKVDAVTAYNNIFNDEKEDNIPKNKGYKRVHDSFQSIFDEELGKVGLTMEDVHRIQNQ